MVLMENMRSTVPSKVGQDLEQYQLFCKKPEHRRAIGAMLIKKAPLQRLTGLDLKAMALRLQGCFGLEKLFHTGCGLGKPVEISLCDVATFVGQ